jgi:membrane protein implicated in regulation of membrane protease activity
VQSNLDAFSLTILGLGVVIAIIGAIGSDFDIGPIDVLSAGSFLVTFGATNWIIYHITDHKTMSILLSVLIAIVVTAILQFTVAPFRKAESSTALRDGDLIGSKAEVILTIPNHGTGEILISTPTGRINRPAMVYETGEIEQGEIVIVMEIKESVCYVLKREVLFP